MTLEALERAKDIVVEIEEARNKIKALEWVCTASKGNAVICTEEKLRGGHNNVDPIYLSDHTLEIIKDAYKNYWQLFIEQKQNELDEL